MLFNATSFGFFYKAIMRHYALPVLPEQHRSKIIPDSSVITCNISPSRIDEIFHNQHLQSCITSI